MHFTQLGTEADDKMVGQFLATKKAVHKVTEAQLGCPRPIECVVVIARAAVARGVPVAVATSGLREHVEAHIEAAGLSDIFNARLGNVVCAADVAKGKPAPDIFIEAARRINVPPNQCRAYEDGGTICSFPPNRHRPHYAFSHRTRSTSRCVQSLGSHRPSLLGVR